MQGQAQDESKASYSLWRNEEDYSIDWTRNAADLERFVLALGYPYAGASTFLEDAPLRVLDVGVVDDVEFENRQPGKIFRLEDGCPVVVCGKGLLRITEAKLADGSSLVPMKRLKVRFR